jgi:putative addiction module killer protein
VYKIEHYVTRDGKDIFALWHQRIRDQRVRLAVDRRLNRIADGNFGDHKPCGSGVWELRFDLGPGHRIYYAISNGKIVLLLCAGDKSSQTDDIERAITFWTDWKERDDEN